MASNEYPTTYIVQGETTKNIYLGPVVQKLTTSLVNDSLKFKLNDTQIC